MTDKIELDPYSICLEVTDYSPNANVRFVFMLPVMATWIITGISAIQTILSEIIWS